jgi:hypothetical protein
VVVQFVDRSPFADNVRMSALPLPEPELLRNEAEYLDFEEAAVPPTAADWHVSRARDRGGLPTNRWARQPTEVALGAQLLRASGSRQAQVRRRRVHNR